LQNKEGSEMRPGDLEENIDRAHAPLTPSFSFPVRIPSFLLDEYLHLRGKDFIQGIAISSHIDEVQELLLYRVHLEHGFSIDINVGFVEIIVTEEENRT
jgi:hypothetical protein